ncbi:Fic family protein [Ursidibacter sp. B-7004-1]
MKPPFSITNSMLNKVVAISHKLGTLQTQYERNLHLRKENRIRSIQSSLAIENNSLTLEQVTAIIEGKRVLGHPREIQEVKNAYDAYDEMMSYDPYSIDDFLKAHQLLTQGIVNQTGQFRSKDVGIYNSSGQLIHMGARPQFVEKLVSDLFQWAKEDDIPSLIKSAVVHYEIEMIHPFEDCNGRIGRLWQNVILSQWNPIFAWIPVETIVYDHQSRYYQVLAEADNANDSTVFIEFMLDVILETLENYSI